jgi:hypothetical protein
MYSAAAPTDKADSEQGEQPVSPTFVKLMRHIGYKTELDLSQLLRPKQRNTTSNFSSRKSRFQSQVPLALSSSDSSSSCDEEYEKFAQKHRH